MAVPVWRRRRRSVQIWGWGCTDAEDVVGVAVEELLGVLQRTVHHLNPHFGYHISGFGYQVCGLGMGVQSSADCTPPGIEFRVSRFGFRVSSFCVEELLGVLQRTVHHLHPRQRVLY